MINDLLRFWWKYNREKITKQSLTDCHVKGLNSIMFNQTEGMRVRMFVTDPDHCLDHCRAVAFHTHRYDIQIHVLYGMVTNVFAKFHPYPLGDYQAYKYKSCILDGKGSFSKTNDDRFINFSSSASLLRGDKLFLDSKKHHTVIVPPGRMCAWLILESTPDPDYEPVVFSDIDITSIDLSELYNPISSEKIDSILMEVL